MTLEEMRLEHLLSVQEDLRGEVKQRVAQRDGFATQFIIACGTVITISLLDFAYSFFLIWFIPIVTIFYSVLILYSYTIHDNITSFLRKHIEPEISRLLKISHPHRQNFLWETRCAYDRTMEKTKFPGIRKGFFEKIIFCAPIISAAIFILLGYFKKDTNGIMYCSVPLLWASAGVAILVFEAIAVYLFLRFRKAHPLETLGNKDYLNLSRKYLSDRAVFLDRDGTIIVDKVQPKDPKEIEFFPDTVEALKKLQADGYLLIIISNQDGIRKGKLTKKEFHAFNEDLLIRLQSEGIQIDAIYYSPYQKDDNHFSFKPNPGMIYLACEDFCLDLQNCYIIGDQHSDYIAGVRAGIKPLYVSTGIYTDAKEKERKEFFDQFKPTVYPNLLSAANAVEKYQ